MANIDGGTLSFTSELDNSQIKQAIDETIARVQGLSDASVAGGAEMAQAFGKAASEIRTKISEVGAACEQHERAIADLESRYNELGQQAAKAFMNGRDAEAKAIQEQQRAIQGEIKVRESLLNELREQSDVLETEASRMEENAQAANDNANAHQSMRARIKELKEALVEMEASGQRGTEQYRQMQEEVARLTDAWGDAQAQATILANDQAVFQGLMSGLTGLTGGFTAVSSAVSLFAGENENLQAAMLKVQQLMSITQGLQAVSEALNKDSAFTLVTLNGLKEWWNNLLAIGTGAQTAETAAKQADVVVEGEQTAAMVAETAAETANTASKTANSTAQAANTTATAANTAGEIANTGAAVAGTAANITLAGAFRMVGAAISSIPVFGWIAAGITALVSAIAIFASKASEGKKAAEEFYNSVADNAYKPIASIEDLSVRWAQLGDDMEAKKQFIEENADAFDALGVSINGVTDAENLLNANKQAFIDSQIEKAKAAVYLQQATDKVKELIEAEQELENMPDTISQWVQTSTMGTGYYIEVHNDAKDAAAQSVADLRKEIEDGFTLAADTERKGWDKLKNAGIEATKVYADGTLGAIEQAIRLKQEALKNLTNNDQYRAAMAEIEQLQKQADAITGKTTTSSSGGGGGSTHRTSYTPRKTTSSSGGGSKKDPFTEKLEKMKAEYQRFEKWMNSGDDILVNSAKQEFEGILKQGSTYIDYLKRQRDQIESIDIAGRTKAQNKQLRQLNDAIAEETKSSVLQAFNEELNTQLANAQTIIEELNIIEQRRKELANDGTELDNDKSDALDKAEDKVKQQAETELTQLLDNYGSYVDKKRKMEEDFNNDIALLERARLNATSDTERASIDAAIANRKRQYQQDSQTSGDEDYDKLLSDYQSFEQQKKTINDDYNEKRRVATEHNNTELLEQLNTAEQEALSKLALETLKASPDWSAMFGNLDEISTKKIEELIQKINKMGGAYLGIQLDPKDLAELMEKLNAMKDEIKQRDPFKALISSIKDYSNAADKESKKKAFTDMMESGSESCKLLSSGLSDCSKMLVSFGMDSDSEAAEVLGNLTAIADGAAQVFEGIASGNPAAIFSGVASVVSSLADWISGDSAKQRQIENWQKAIDKLSNAYKQLSWEIDNALGDSYYSTSKAAIQNMKEQQAYLQQMWEAEEDKKHTDDSKVEEYKEEYRQLTRDIEDMLDEISEDITQTDASTMAQSIADSLVQAFEEGTDAAKAFGDVVNDVLKNAVINQLKKKFLETQLQGALDDLESSMGYWDGDDFVFDGLTDAEIASFKAKVAAASQNFNDALNIYKDLFDSSDDSDTSLSGAVKGVSEETANILAGQMNAIRINQVEASETLRASLLQLNTIAMNTEYCRHLAKIDRVITLLENGTDSSLRSQGLG